jgi:predicted AlkP superfamily phosphohydrolase/phosphomutase
MTSHAKELLVLGLDGFDPEVAQQLMYAGELPALARLQRSAHSFRIEPGIEKYTGLVWEQFCSALTPDQSRWSASILDTQRYVPTQPDTRLVPFTESLKARTVVFDVPHFNLASSAQARGLVAWGSHDPGVAPSSTPVELAGEIAQRFGPYPAEEFIYGHVWHDPRQAETMAEAMVKAVELRSDITKWLFAERFADWDLAITVIAEYHSATEALWHGWDETHPLHSKASAEPARAGLVGVYKAADRMLGRMLEEFADCAILAFSPHGMGRNFADVPAMLLLPELIYRDCTGKIGFRADENWALDGTAAPNLPVHEDWSTTVNKRINFEAKRTGWFRRAQPMAQKISLDWMPAARYRAAWPNMRAYATPAYYDGRVRVNLQGRESRGMVSIENYPDVVDEIDGLIRGCRDPLSGAPLDIEIERRPGNPLTRDPSDADLIIRFNKDYYAFQSERLGLIGPAPCRRPGGHTGGPGVGYFLPRRAGATTALGSFPAAEMSGAVSALMGTNSAVCRLGTALLHVAK